MFLHGTDPHGSPPPQVVVVELHRLTLEPEQLYRLMLTTLPLLVEDLPELLTPQDTLEEQLMELLQAELLPLETLLLTQPPAFGSA